MKPIPGPDQHPRVVVIGGGFGGLLTARSLAKAPVRITLLDRRNHHLFQPLLYQVATGSLSPANIAAPLRTLVRKQKHTRVLLEEVTGFDLDARAVLLGQKRLAYDYLVVAAGAGQSYFGNDQWAERAPGLKSLEDATRIRRRVLLAYEEAEKETDPERIRELVTFVVVGAGPTGVELAGALAEVAHSTLKGEFRHIDTGSARVILVEGADRVLPPFPEGLSARARKSLEDLGVEVRTGMMVKNIDSRGLDLAATDDDDQTERIRATNVLWAAGVQASPLGAMIAEQSEAEVDRAGRVEVEHDCSVRGRPEVFVIGDLASFCHQREEPLPGLAPVAMQQGRYVGRVIADRIRGVDRRPEPFSYVDKGNMAVIGRRRAVADINGLEVSGVLAWLMWLFVHLLYLAAFENRVLVMVQWGWNYFTRNRSARLITSIGREARSESGAEDASASGEGPETESAAPDGSPSERNRIGTAS